MSSVLRPSIASLREFTRARAMPQQDVGIFQSAAAATMRDDRRVVATDDNGPNVTMAVSDSDLARSYQPVTIPDWVCGIKPATGWPVNAMRLFKAMVRNVKDDL